MNSNDETSKILIISQHFPPDKSGNASRIHDLSVNLSLKDVGVTVIAPYPSFPHGIFEKKWNSHVKIEINPKLRLINIFSWQPKRRDPSFLSRMFYYLTFPLNAILAIFTYSKQYDIVITSTPPIFTCIPGLFAKVVLRKKWVIDCRDMWVDAAISLGFLKEKSVAEKITRKFLRICFKRTDMVFVTTEGITKRLSETYEIKKPIRVIANGFDSKLFYPHEVSKKNRIIYSGNVGHAQDLENCILAMEKVLEKHDLELLIVGEGDNKKELEELTLKKGLGECVKFKGLVPREEVPELISESLIGLAPLKSLESLDYAIPSKIYEYMACGVPFIGCGIGEIVRISENSKAGIITENDPDSIAEVIIDLLENPKKREEMGINGIEHAKEYYDRENIAMKIKSLLNEI